MFSRLKFDCTLVVVGVVGLLLGSSRCGGAPYQHVLILSIDGLREADLADPATAAYLPNIRAFEQSAIHYSNAHTVTPSDSVPASLSYFTGAGPKTTGVYYEDSYDRSLYAPGGFLGGPQGTEFALTEVLDNNANVLNGGGNSDASSLSQFNLPQKDVGGSSVRVLPHDYLRVNTVFEVAKAAGMRTGYIEKHPAYEIIGGPSGSGLDDFYAPESNAKVKLVNGALVDSSKGERITKQVSLSQVYDDMRLAALTNQMSGFDTRRLVAAPTPAIYGMNFIGLNTAEKDSSGGISLDSSGNEVVSPLMASGLAHVDESFRQIMGNLRGFGQANNTLVILTSHNGNSPRVGAAVQLPGDYLTTPLAADGIGVKQVTQDDSALVWLNDANQTAKAAADIAAIDPDVIDSVLSGDALLAAGFGDPATDARAPDLVVKFKEGYLVGNGKLSEHGGFNDDDTHIALLVGSDGLAADLKGLTIDGAVWQTQIAVTTLLVLGLDPAELEGAMIEGTQALPTSAVPEPGGLIVLVSGVIVVGWRGRRRKFGVVEVSE
jgi:hypothetical protein